MYESGGRDEIDACTGVFVCMNGRRLIFCFVYLEERHADVRELHVGVVPKAVLLWIEGQ